MSERTIIHIVGNRPQFVKLAVLHRAILTNGRLKQIIVHTGQHYSEEMNDIFFDELTIPVPDFHFDHLPAGGDLFIAHSVRSIQEILSLQPANSLVMTYGDTNSTLAGAFAAVRSGRKLLHFESGVRTTNKSMPEEINRILTDRLSDVHFCCTEQNYRNLMEEGYGDAIPGQVFLTGDLMLDAYNKIAKTEDSISRTTDYILCTIHRAENISRREALSQILEALDVVHQECEVIIPLHPHTARMMQEYGLSTKCTVIHPVGYGGMKTLMENASYVISDSGGTVREAYFSKKKSVVIMKDPFWPEIIAANASLRADATKESILTRFYALEKLEPHFELPIFGTGNAAENIVRHLNTLPEQQ